MNTLTQPYVSDERPGPHVTPCFLRAVEQAAARLGLPREYWAA